MSLPNGPEIVVAFLGVVAAGAAAAPLNQAYTADEFHAYLEDLRRARCSSCAARRAGARGLRRARRPRSSSSSARRRHALTVAAASGAALPARDPEAVALLLHTSGTTSKPEGRADPAAQPRRLRARDRRHLRPRQATTRATA